MRSLVAAFCLAACSTPQVAPITKDPATAAAPVGGAIDAARTWRFVFDVSGEISCSQSYESQSTYGTYVLSVTPPHAATLRFERVEASTFGSNRFDVPASPANHSEQRLVRDFEGQVGRAGDDLSFTLWERAADCPKDPSDCAGPLTFTCKPSHAAVVSWRNDGKHVDDAPALRCDTSFGLPSELEEAGWKGGLVFGDGSGLFLDYVVRGPMEHAPELRRAP